MLTVMLFSAVMLAAESPKSPDHAIYADHFDATSPSLCGGNWKIEKFSVLDHGDPLWSARLIVDGKERAVFGDAGRYEDWIRFYLWPPAPKEPQLLFVHRVAGGSDGQETVSVVDLKDDCRVVFDGEHFSFQCLVEFGDGGYPELVGGSNVFSYYAYALHIASAESMRPPRVATYIPAKKRYYFANKRYPQFFEPTLAWYKSEFESNFSDMAPIPADTVAMGLQSSTRDALLHVLYWAVYIGYVQDFKAAKAIIDAHCDTALAKFTNHFLWREMSHDGQGGSAEVEAYVNAPVAVDPAMAVTADSIRYDGRALR